MKKKFDSLNKTIIHCYSEVDSGKDSPKELKSYVMKVTDAAAKIYKEDEENVYMPFINGDREVINVNNHLYFIVYSDKKYITNPSITEIRKIKFNDVCSEAFETKNVYYYVDHPEEIHKHGSDYSKEEIQNYIYNHTDVAGVIYDYGTEHEYVFSDWQLDVLIYKGCGIDDTDVIILDEIKKEEINNEN